MLDRSRGGMSRTRSGIASAGLKFCSLISQRTGGFGPGSKSPRASVAARPEMNDVIQSDRAESSPAYFHLLWDYELKALAPILDAVLRRRDEVLQHWHELYVLHFGDSRSLPQREFME